MSEFILYKRDNPCPSCGSTKGNCKKSKTLPLILCMGDAINPPAGYHYAGRTKDGLWAKYTLGDDRADAVTRETWRLQAEAIKRKHQEKEGQQRARLLSLEDRHKFNSRLLGELREANGLHPDDRADLKRRGLSDGQVEAWGVVSVTQSQQLTQTYPQNLAGIGKDGRSLLVGGDGYLCPIRNVDGLITGFQVRLRGAVDNKYRWLAGNDRHHLPNGENPLAVFGDPSSDRAYLVEGVGAKPFITAQRLSGLVIGAAGGQWASSPEQLEALCKGRKTVLVPDGGAVSNLHVLGQYRRLAALYPDLQVLWWGQVAKGSDVDEVDLLSLNQAQLIPWTAFEAIAKSEKRNGYQQKSEEIRHGLCALLREPDERRNERYLSAIEALRPGGITAISSPCNTGKTTQLKDVVEQQRERHPDGKVLMIGYRNGLLRQTGRKIGIPLIHDLGHNGITPSLKNVKEVALCVDSILRINPEDIPEGSLLIGDEIDGTIKHMLSGETLKDKQAKILQHLQLILRTVLERGGSIIALEDGLGDLPLQFLEEATGVRPRLILNTHQADPWDVEMGTKSVSGFSTEILIRLVQGERLCIATSSQEYAEKLETLARQLGLRVLRVDSETAELPEVKAFQENPDRYLAANRIQLLIYTPTIESGVSIEGAHFDAVYGYFTHLEDRAQFQLLNRYRRPVSRHILCTEFTSSNEGWSCNPATVLKDWEQSTRRTAAITKVKASLDQALEHDPTSDKALQRVEAFKNLDSTDARFWNTWIARYQARASGSQMRMHDNLKALLEARGHRVTRTDWGIDKETSKDLNQAKQAIQRRKARELNEVDCGDMTIEEAHQILANPTATKTDRLAARKRLLQDRLPGDPLDADFLQQVIIADRSRFLRSTKLLWLTDHPEVAAHLDRVSFKAQLDKPFVIHKQLTHYRLKVTTILMTGVKALTDGREYRETDDLVQLIKRNALKERHDIWRYLKLTIKEEHTGIDICNKLLRRLGFEPEDIRREGPRGNRTRVYSVQPTEAMKADPDFVDWESYRQRILAAFEVKYADLLETSEEAPPSPVSTISNTSLVINENVDTSPETQLDPAWKTPEAIAEAREILALATDPETRRQLKAYIPPQIWAAIAS